MSESDSRGIAISIPQLSKPLEFPDAGSLAQWIRDEFERWYRVSQLIAPHANRLGMESYASSIERVVTKWQSRAGQWAPQSDVPTEERVRDIQKDLSSGRLVVSTSPAVHAAMSIAESGPEAALILLAMACPGGRSHYMSLTDQSFNYFLNSIFASAASAKLAEFSPSVRGLLDESRIDRASLADLLEEARNERQVLVSEFRDQLRALKKEVDDQKQEISAQAATQREQIDAVWTKLKETYDFQIKTHAPHHYWHSKQQSHLWYAIGFGTAFLAVVCMVFYLIWAGSLQASLSASSSLAQTLGNHGWIVLALAFGVPAYLLVWILRLLARQVGDHLLRHEDARERVVLVDTFAALLRSEDSKTPLTNDHLIQILQALFRPGPGLGSDDSPPAGLVELLVRRPKP